MENKIVLASLAMDLKRVALGLHRKSNSMADRFLQEAMQRKKEVDTKKLLPYMQHILMKLNSNIDAENALMYSTRIQNYVLYK
ncbi:hypothetical protein A2363_01715 [Candidatus Gottesmanbacteria bacterium RIFOXYB1_FULL_47_11]|uniref:Uncharacterized protein n=1 Tax=Candidatus Gottesmanbacteria bacterium RIFOXYB1_FULL_47_11 TaxID=1798401 RepID=A0A1F6BD94_9BACT|nr:MAG: hypothetical protein A2363_01715 [Candidatus Gottesmanbacteria bacterium RIFOXYB1_FULL_47_11]